MISQLHIALLIDMGKEEAPQELDSDIQIDQGEACPFCRYQGTWKGTAMLLVAWVFIPLLLLMMVILTET
ncbi:MAG: hypothetical protein EAX95_08425 [Candidatus Thorarchaeota archaeon]|nr:hypothetical protein [Candidatus Thorarchaeota archaeon]